MTFKKGYASWNKGLTKETDERVKINSINISNRMRGKKLTEERKDYIRNIARINTNFGMKGKHHNKLSKDKIRKANIGRIKSLEDKKKMSKGHLGKISGMSGKKQTIKWIEMRNKLVMPTKDTTIEIKMQNLLKELGINFLTHQHMKEAGYQCDIFIPVQQGIDKKTIIECFGDYWHSYPLARPIDNERCKKLREAGWRVLVFWECEIRPMELINLREKIIC